MNIRYLFVICIVVLCFSSVVQACDHTAIQGEKAVITASATDSFSSKQVGSLLNEVVIPAAPGTHGIFWKSVALMFQKVKQVYVALGGYLYASITSIFNW
ncbi:hypothetical protein LBE40_03310 [Bartonella taylorii]|uniref:Uncharacterized protein n=2 Tax=Bartonella taylorii TaxID=33046 RepID=A0A9Q8YXZ3_BARTA|nr:hypothetical protein [Bartonella taylorii]EJF94090.1 hypothetical protein ME9_01011 [Bartonella taylorii 8TBB]OPB34880.1 hypothetical protein Btaycd_010620 [Bartonella taylorii]USP01839.1 hypothetical protein LBE40_03310 [Bartonella taylorii]USP03164.1 hypothetical protein LAJ60_01555 [Bartonella taylorii]